MKVLIDTNVLIDYMSQREPFYADALKVVDLCVESVIDGFIAAHSITNSFYILRRYPQKDVRVLLTQMCNVMTVVGISDVKLISAIKNLDFDDMEDCLQAVCAEECGAEYIITRNTKDFDNSKVLPITPGEFLLNLTEK